MCKKRLLNQKNRVFLASKGVGSSLDEFAPWDSFILFWPKFVLFYFEKCRLHISVIFVLLVKSNILHL